MDIIFNTKRAKIGIMKVKDRKNFSFLCRASHKDKINKWVAAGSRKVCLELDSVHEAPFRPQLIDNG